MRKLKILMVGISLLTSSWVFSQTKEITGKVIDLTGAAIPGATIKVKGAKGGVSAGSDGIFKLIVQENATLIISGVGFETKEIKAGNLSNLVIQLSQDTRSLNEVVVTGVGTATSKRKLGISVESVSGDKLPQVPIASLDQALIGKIPGAQISSVSGNPGDQVNIVLRGINSIQGGTRPMILMDGVEIPFADLNTIDLTQVARVEVVQGAASSSLYGAQGANGVIQIFSKKGTKGKMTINFTTSYGSSSFINSGHFAKSSLHPYLTNSSGNIIAYDTAGGFNTGDEISVDPTIGAVLGDMAYRYGSDNNPNAVSGEGASNARYGILDPLNTSDQPYKGSMHYYDHFKQVFESAPSYNNTLSISGGGDKVDYNFAMSNNRTNSPLLQNNGYVDRTNLTANAGMELFKGFTLRSITNVIYTENTLHPGMGAPGGANFGYGTSNANVGSVYSFLNTPAFINLEDTILGGVPAAEYFQSNINIAANAFNPFYSEHYSKGDGNRYDILQSFEANYKVNRFVSLRGLYGVAYKNENDIWTYYNQSLNANSNYYGGWASWNNGTDNTGEVDNWQYDQVKQNLTATASVKLDFEKDFHLKLPIQSTTLGGYDFRKNTYKEIDFYGYSLPLQPPFEFLSTQSQALNYQYNETAVTYGYLLDQRFDIGNWAGVAGGFRTDYSSAFGKGHTPFTFPHINGYINLPSFNFWEGGLSNVLPNFKLRASYGKAGIQPGAYQRQSTLNLQPTGSQLAYANPTEANNPGLGVEVSAETEYGTDFTVQTGNNASWLRNFNFSLTFWKRHTDNAIYARVLPPSTGSASIVDNVIALSSNGWQLSVNIPVYQTKNWAWDFTANFGHQTSMINSIVGGDIPLTSGAGSSSEILRAGTKIGQIYGYKVLTSVNQLRADGKTPFIDVADQPNYSVVNGYVVNNQSKWLFISDEPSTLGDPNPKLTSSFINSVTYKGFLSLGFQFDWIYGSHLYDQTDEWLYREGISGDWDKPVTINGQKGAWTAYYASAYYGLGTTAHGTGNDLTKSFFYHDASFWRLRNVSLGIDFSKFVSQNWLKKCQLVLSGRNLLTFTKYPGLDPEISSGSSNSAFDRGIDHSTIPNLKSYQATLNVTL